MAVQLDQRIKTITDQRNEQQAILAGMAEGVIAVNADEKIISINQVACRMFDIEPERAQGKRLNSAIREVELQSLVAKAISAQTDIKAEIVLERPPKRYIYAHAALLREQDGQGAVIVLNDITQIRKLEEMRKEFVANVSHELKTPITSISGFVETLLDGALDEPEDAEKFLKIISKQAEQLNAIIDDLLLLSKMEQEGEKQGIKLDQYKLKGVFMAAIQSLSKKAKLKNVDIKLSCEQDLSARINQSLLTHAVINLLDNAINYSEPQSRVELTALQKEGEIKIAVSDQGQGIAKQHLPRLFERFYRVDKARSRKQGGTGLGLAIAKHIAAAHRGYIDVQSEPGQGSTFTIHLPAE